MITIVVSLLAAVGYLALIILAAVRRARGTQRQWIAAVGFWSSLFSLSFTLEALNLRLGDLASGVWVSTISLMGMCLLGALTFAYLEMPRPWIWAVGILPLIAATLALEFFSPPPGLSELSWHAALFDAFSISAYGAATLWLLIFILLTTITIQQLLAARLPLHANRVLWWLGVLPAIVFGEAAAMWAPGFLSHIGQLLRFAGLAGAVYGATTANLIDVRGLLRAGVGNAVFVALSSVITLLGIGMGYFLLTILPGIQGQLVVILLAFLLALTYQGIRAFLGQVVQQAVLQTGYDTAQTAADYSKRIAQLLDVGELATAAVSALSRSIESSRSAILLLSPEQAAMRIETYTGLGTVPSSTHRMSTDNAFLAELISNRQPLLQYTIEVEPRFQSLNATDRRWLQKLGMDVYAPVFEGDTLSAVLAVGPRKSGDPYRARELQLLTTLADQTSSALRNARLVTNLRTLNEEMRALNLKLEKRAEQLKELDRVKTDFINIASHELRTPLTQILGFADILLMIRDGGTVGPEELLRIVDSITNASGRLNEVVLQMLDVSEIDVAAMRLNFRETTMEDVLRDAVEPLAPAIRDRGLRLIAQGIRNLPPLTGDPNRLSQAFAHVIGNAIKFTPDGGHIDLLGKYLPRSEGQIESVEITIADSGVGINPKYLDLIFEKFYRVGSTALHSTGTTKYMGAGPGLGLPIAKGIIEGHGGTIRAESLGFDMKKLPGTTIRITLPIQPPPFVTKDPTPLSSDSALIG